MRRCAYRLLTVAAAALIIASAPDHSLAQGCSHYLNTTDGDNSNDGTSPGMAVRSFEFAFLQFPSGSTVCVTAGEYFHESDRDGIHLREPDKSMTFVLESFASRDAVIFSEDVFVVDVGSGTITFAAGSTNLLRFGSGEANTLERFPDNTTFLHSIELKSGVLDMSSVDVIIGASVGNPSFSQSHESLTRTAPDSAAISRSGGRLIGNLSYESAPRTIRYEGDGAISPGAELPAQLDAGTLLFATNSGMMTVDRNLTLRDGAAIRQVGSGDVRFTVPLTIATSGGAVIVASGSGDLLLEEGLSITADADAGVIVENQGSGALATGPIILLGTAVEPISATFRNSASGTLNVESLVALESDAGIRASATIEALNGRIELSGSPLEADLTVEESGAVFLRSDVRLSGQLENRGMIELDMFDLTPASGEHVNAGTIQAAGDGALVLSEPVSLTGSGALANVRATSGASAVAAGDVAGSVIVGGTAVLELSVAGIIQGNVRTQDSGRLVLSEPLAVEGAVVLLGNSSVTSTSRLTAGGVIEITDDAVLEGGERLSVGGDLTLEGGVFRSADSTFIAGVLVQLPGSTLDYEGDVLTAQGDFVRTGGTVMNEGGQLRLASSETQTLLPGAGFSAFDLRIAGARTSLGHGPLEVRHNFVVEAGSTLLLGGNDVVLTGSGAISRVDGNIETEEEGFLVFADTTADADRQRMSGSGVYGNTRIRLSAPSDWIVLASPEIRQAGSLQFENGSIDLSGNTYRLVDVNRVPGVHRNLSSGAAANGLRGGGLFDVPSTGYNLTYTGHTTTESRPGRELVADRVMDLTLRTSGAPMVIQSAVRLSGSLYVHSSTVLRLDVGGVTSVGFGYRHVVAGRVAGPGVFRLAGSGLLVGEPTVGQSTVDQLAVAGIVDVVDLRHIANLSMESGALLLEVAHTSSVAPLDSVVIRDGEMTIDTATAIGRYLEQTGGDLNLLEHDLTLTGSGTVLNLLGGTFRSTGGLLVFDGSGEQVMRAASTVSIPRMRIVNDVRLAGESTFTITELFAFGADGASLLFEAPTSAVAFGDGTRIIREGTGVIENPPVIAVGAAVGVVYRAGVVTGHELRSATGTLALLAIETPDDVTLDRSVTVGDSLLLKAGNLRTSATASVTMAPGSHIQQAGGRINASGEGQNVRGGPITLTYETVSGAARASSGEFPGTVEVKRLAVHGPLGFVLHDDRTVDSLIVATTDAFDLGGMALTVSGNASVDSGAVISRSGTGALIVEGHLDVGPAAAILDDPSSPPIGSVKVTVKGSMDIQGRFGAAELMSHGDVTAGAAAQLSSNTVFYALGRLQTFTLNNGDDDPATVDAELGRLVLGMAGDSRITDGPKLLVRSDGPAHITLGVSSIHFTNGVLATSRSDIRLTGSGRGFTRDAPFGDVSHIVGTVSRVIDPATSSAPALFEFPVGSDYPQAYFRPAAISFPSLSAVSQPTVIAVSHRNQPPRGAAGFPIEGGDGLVLRSPAPLYWSVSATPSIDGAQEFSIALTATQFPYLESNPVETLRIIRRGEASLSEPYVLHGVPERYDNVLVDLPQPATPVVRVSNVSGGLDATGWRYAIGLQENLTSVSRMQFLHAAPEDDLNLVDLYLDGDRVADDLAFGSGTAFLDIEPETHELAIAPSTSESVAEAFFVDSLDVRERRDYLVGLSGVADTTVSTLPALDLFVTDRAIAFPEQSGNVRMTLFHGAPGSGALHVRATDGDTLLTAAGLGHYAESYATLPATTHSLSLGGSATAMDTYMVDLSSYADVSITAVASGSSAEELRLTFVVNDGRTIPAVVTVDADEPVRAPPALRLRGSFPNPADAAATILFDLPESARIWIEVYDLLGRRVIVRPAERMDAGASQAIRLDTGGLAAGLYVFRLVAQGAGDRFEESGRITVIR